MKIIDTYKTTDQAERLARQAAICQRCILLLKSAGRCAKG